MVIEDKHPRGFLANRAIELLRDGGLMLDLGCGDGSYWRNILLEHPDIRYVGIDRFPGRRLDDVSNAEMHRGDATRRDCLEKVLAGRQPALIASKSALEHIYVSQRVTFLNTVASILPSGGSFLLQYDQGHFMEGVIQDVKNAISRPLNRAGFRRFQYAKPLDVERYTDRIRAAGFEIVTTRCEGVPGVKWLLNTIPPATRGRAEELLHAFEHEVSDILPLEHARRHFAAVIWELRKR